jgi:hypothetical protein
MNKSLCLVSGLLMILSSCSQDSGATDNPPYFKFLDADKNKLIKPEMIGNVIKYKNQFNVIRQFEVSRCAIESQAYGFASFWGNSSTVDYTFDTQQTELKYFDANGSLYCNISFSKTPSQRTGTYPYVYSNPVLSGSVDFSLYNYDCGDPYSLDCGKVSVVDGYQFLQSMDIEGKHYDKVKVFYSGSNLVVQSPYDGLHDRTVNKFYYSDDYGIIGYDEIDGTTWRRVN